ncbi:MAG: Cupredoxin-like domain [Frankiales bacterium]|jgi:plastocyanin|nr:Cupredoxin-like domain [Frankiales bacterium]MDX6208945.1 Cupredoxin-like domain [Frankiales bacterium]
MSGNRLVLGIGAVTAVSVLLGAQGCQRQSPRFDRTPASAPAVVASVGPSGDQTVTLQMTDLFRFEPANVVVRAGKITVTLANAGDDPHQFEVPSLNVSTGNIPGHTTKTVTFTIPKGVATYAFDCAYHTSEHMVGTLTVQGF